MYGSCTDPKQSNVHTLCRAHIVDHTTHGFFFRSRLERQRFDGRFRFQDCLSAVDSRCLVSTTSSCRRRIGVEFIQKIRKFGNIPGDHFLQRASSKVWSFPMQLWPQRALLPLLMLSRS